MYLVGDPYQRPKVLFNIYNNSTSAPLSEIKKMCSQSNWYIGLNNRKIMQAASNSDEKNFKVEKVSVLKILA